MSSVESFFKNLADFFLSLKATQRLNSSQQLKTNAAKHCTFTVALLIYGLRQKSLNSAFFQ